MGLKRFYKQAESGTAPGGYTVRLDGRNIRTPLQHPLILPTPHLAAAIAAEWDAQGDAVDPSSMPLSQLAHTMIDKAAGPDRAEMDAEILKYAGSDLVCYYATHPADLLARQEALWHPLLAWVQDEFGVVLEPVSGIRYHTQPAATLEKLSQVIRGLDAARFTVAQAVTGVTGSAVIGLALAAGRIGAEQAHAAATVDKAYQLEKWGEDAPARARLDRIAAELAAIEKFRFLVTASA